MGDRIRGTESREVLSVMEELLPSQLRDVLTAIDADPRAPVRVVLSGPPGYGKSTALAAVARHYRAATVTVVSRDDLRTGKPAADAVVLIDDADTLAPDEQEVLIDLAAGVSRLVVTHTPGAAGFVAAELLTSVTRHVRLPGWTVQDVARFAGRPLGPERAAAVQRATAGVPRLVARCLAAPVVDELIDELRSELDQLGEQGTTYLIVAGVAGGRDIELLAVALGGSRDDVSAVVDRVRGAGLLAADDTVPPVVARAVRDHVGVDRMLTVLVRMLEALLVAGQPVLPIARELQRLGAGGAVVREGLEAAAAEVVLDDPAVAADLYAAAARGGSSRTRLAPAWARAAVLSGRLDLALRLGDELLGSADPTARHRGALVVGTVMARRGDLARGAELLRWSGEPGALLLADLAGVALGEVAAEEQTAAGTPVPAYGHVAGRLLDGIRESVTGRSEAALTTLLASADTAEATGMAHLLPDSPAALTATVALHAAEFDLAHGVLTRAAASERHELLLGWTAMLRGDLATAETHRSTVQERAGRLPPRDELFLRALELGLARRADTPDATRGSWAGAYEAMMRQPADLFSLLPLGELLIAAARVGEGFRVVAHRERAFELLTRLGRPMLWSAWLDWSVFHAAVVSGDRQAARDAIENLSGHSTSGRLVPAFAAAGAQWLAVLDGVIDVEAVLAGAGLLHRAGLSWDAARLTGQAAIRATDRTAMTTLLRAVKRFPSAVSGVAETAASALAEPPALTPRESDIGRLVVDGHTYREIGELLHISGKTVEHHMARIRAKLGAQDRRTTTALLSGILGGE
ncbi:LuxR C-terminal-related transcriptional regulator [Amycolatopsis thailandensis]|uniref:helix-turn-helix transcriptional regulator n=1 Tax=Amycolatopsis thailandensis TaxID=589330 RepID=UPI0037A8F3D8